MQFLQIETMKFLKLARYVGEDVLIAKIGAVKAFSNRGNGRDDRKLRRERPWGIIPASRKGISQIVQPGQIDYLPAYRRKSAYL